jgi:NADH-quinone oxidoreductase subunit C
MRIDELHNRIQERFGEVIRDAKVALGELTIELAPTELLDTCLALRDEQDFLFEQLLDVCGVDYAAYGKAEWATEETTSTGFSRGVDVNSAARLAGLDEELSVETNSEARRFASVYHLLSVTNNQRLRIRVFAPDEQLPVIPSVIELWSSANWFEREAFDLFGIIYEGHPDLRRILTDYGFIGHPFRKDFPLSGNVEVRYDAEKQRVIYQAVSIEPRVLVPRVIRETAAEEVAESPVEEEAASQDNEE